MNKDDLKNIFYKLTKDKKTQVILLIGFIGMFFVLISEIETEADINEYESSVERSIYTESELAYEVEKLIETIDGAGKTKVMITYKSYEETVYAYDKDEISNSEGEFDFRSEYIIVDGKDKEEGLKVKILLPEIKGIAVVCQGGENPVTKEQIISALSALFNISSNKISVAAMAN